MIERILFGAAVIVAGVFTFTPRSDSLDFEPVSSDIKGGPQSRSAISSSKSWDGSSSTLKRREDGHFYANAYVDGVKTHFLVDTGASVVALTGADAEDLGLDWHEDEIRPIGTGASGAVYGVPVTLTSVELGGYEARSVAAVVIPHGLEISLLGQSFLGTIDNVNISGDEMILGE